jgi:hypothetical protein
MTLKQIVDQIRLEGKQCNCDLDNYEPEQDTGHSFVCRIHKIAKERYRNQIKPDIATENN